MIRQIVDDLHLSEISHARGDICAKFGHGMAMTQQHNIPLKWFHNS